VVTHRPTKNKLSESDMAEALRGTDVKINIGK
jgi:hypothetical protein